MREHTREAAAGTADLSDQLNNGWEPQEFKRLDDGRQVARKTPVKYAFSKLARDRKLAQFAEIAKTPYFAAFIQSVTDIYLAQNPPHTLYMEEESILVHFYCHSVSATLNHQSHSVSDSASAKRCLQLFRQKSKTHTPISVLVSEDVSASHSMGSRFNV